MDLGLQKKRAYVMAASTGIGFAIAKKLADEGAQVAISSSNQEKIIKAAEMIPGAIPLVADFHLEGASQATAEKAASKMGGIDILVTNAGGPPKGSFRDLSMQDWKTGFQTLWIAAIEAINVALRLMAENQWGRIIFSTSVAAKEPLSSILTTSNALRSGLLGLMKTISQDFAKDGITVNTLMPGYVNTERLQKFPIPHEEIITKIPAGRLGDPEEIASLAAFIASEQAGYITGQAIACDGGLLKGV
jgi:3-oxoacyl-[acyl-carrier protein] reductase